MKSDILVFGKPPLSDINAFRAALNAPELRPLRLLAQEAWPQVLKYHSSFLRDANLIRFVLGEGAKTSSIFTTHAATLQDGLAPAWRDATTNATKYQVDECRMNLVNSSSQERMALSLEHLQEWFKMQRLTAYFSHDSNWDGLFFYSYHHSEAVDASREPWFSDSVFHGGPGARGLRRRGLWGCGTELCS